MARRWFGRLTALAGLALAGGCCSWCERHCPPAQACAPACYPAAQPCCPPACAPSGYQPAAPAPAGSWTNPAGACAPATGHP